MSGVHDFDFFIGAWRVHHRQLKARLAGCVEWAEFSGTASTQKILGGHGNIDDNVIEKPEGAYRAATLRTFDPVTRQWAIWWFDGRAPHGPVDPPMVGGFEQGVGTFYADDHFEGRPIRVRFVWTVGSAGAPRWEQAFSVDAGKTWETNWVMDFTPVTAPARVPRAIAVH